MTPEDRKAGVLLPLFSVRTKNGWGVGEIPDLEVLAAWAAQAQLAIVQLLPVNEVRGGETSPYSASSAFAIDPVYLGLDACEDFQAAGGRKALGKEDRRLLDELILSPKVDWPRVRALKDRAARLAFRHFLSADGKRGGKRAKALKDFRCQNEWLNDHALYCALHDHLKKGWKDWPPELRDRDKTALTHAARQNAKEILYQCWLQWQLDRQWQEARKNACRWGVDFMGDLPFVVSWDSSDVWAHREWFRLDRRVGTPPDFFSPTGQDWGLPLYDWPTMARTDFQWMRERARRSGTMYGLFRVDHVIGMYRTYSRSHDGRRASFSPSDEEAQIRLGETLLTIMSGFGQVIAEDLGAVPDFLPPSLARLKVPGYRVLRWEKIETWRNGHKEILVRDPASWPVISVATSGTHDTETQAEWWNNISPEERRAFIALPAMQGLDPHQDFDLRIRDGLLQTLYASRSQLCLLPFQDLMGSRERVNVPGTVNDGNWTYRMPMDLDDLRADQDTTHRLAQLAINNHRGLASKMR